jgi:plastocyanin
MKNSISRSLIVLSLAGAIFAVTSCSSSSNSNPYGNNNGGGGPIFESGTVAPGGSYSHPFMTAGLFPYHCKFHGAAGGSGMSGTIFVKAGGSPSVDTVIMTSVFTFSPAHDTVDVGDTVMWLNNSSMDHTATSDN